MWFSPTIISENIYCWLVLIMQTDSDVCQEWAVHVTSVRSLLEGSINPYPTAFPYGNGMVLHIYQQQKSSTNKTEHKVINKGLKTYVQTLHNGENFHSP